jgi:hypothetical protein
MLTIVKVNSSGMVIVVVTHAHPYAHAVPVAVHIPLPIVKKSKYNYYCSRYPSCFYCKYHDPDPSQYTYRCY